MANETEKNVYVGKEGIQKLWERVVERDVALDRKKVDKVPDAVAGNIPVFVDGGNISDSSLHVVSDKYDDEGQVLPDYEGNIVTGHAVEEAIDDLGVELQDEIDALDAAKADKVKGAAGEDLDGKVVLSDSNGNLKSSGLKIADEVVEGEEVDYDKFSGSVPTGHAVLEVVNDKLDGAIGALDATVATEQSGSPAAGKNFAISVTEEDGVLTGVSITRDDTVNSSDVDTKINALDVDNLEPGDAGYDVNKSHINGFGPDKTLATLTETDGKIDATFQSILVDTANIADEAVTTDKLDDGAVTTTKIDNGAVTTDKIYDKAVTTAKIADSNVTTAKIADANVTEAKLAVDSVTTTKIADLNVTTGKIADSAVTTDKIRDNAITPAKVSNDTYEISIRGNAATASAAESGSALRTELDSKADKVTGATNGNLAGLDASGNLTDSGFKPSDFKTKQEAVADPTASGNSYSFIDTLSQDENGKITVTKKTVQQASTSAAGIVQLSNAIDSTSESTAATPKAVKDAIIAAEQATVSGLDAENTVPDGHYITSVDETDGIVSLTTAEMDSLPTQDSSKPVKSGGVFASIGAEAHDRAAKDAEFQQLIPTAASQYNQLADKAYVDAIGERVEARYLSYSQDGLPFPTYDDFVAAQQTDMFYYMNAITTPNNNDVIVITADRTHLNDNNQPTTTRWRFFKPETGAGEWRYEYTINNSALNEAQLLAINSGINVVKVGNYDGHLVDHNNPHHVTAEQVGLGNVNNTADLDKPISTATQSALDNKADNVVGGTANNIVILGDNGKTLVDSYASITSSYDGTDETNPVTGSAVAAAIGELNAGPFGGEGKYIISVSETAGIVAATEGTLDAEPTNNSTNPVKSGGVYQHLSTKADKDTDAVEANIAVFDENGNPVDSGIPKDDLEAAISLAGSSIQGASIDGTVLQPDANNVVDIPLATTIADGAMSAEDKAKLDGIASDAEVNVQADWTESDSDSDAFIKNKPILATVATTGEYGDLLNIPEDLVRDGDYVHTDNNYTDEEKTRLAGIEAGAEVNVQADWTESDSSSDAYIQNKPENLVQDANYVHTDNNYTDEEKTKLAGIEAGAEVNVIETVKVDDIPLTVTNKTVNIGLTGKADKAVPSAAGNLAGLDAAGNLTDSGISRTLDLAPTENSENLVTSGAVFNALSGKTDKVSGATDGNFVGLDANGNLKDSGKNSSDFATAAQGATADTAVQSVKLDSIELKSGTDVIIPLAGNTAGTGTAGAMSGADKVKLDSVAAGAEVNVQSDWNESDSSSDAFIKNKPANLVQDANYVHTDNNYTTAEKNKLSGIAAGAEVNVQSDWAESDSDSDAFIKNKPSLATVATTGRYSDLLGIPENIVQDANYVHTDNNYTAAEKNKLSDIAAGAEVNVQADWTETDNDSDAYIQNKPANLVQDANYVHTDNNYTTTEKNKLSGIAAGAEVNVQADWTESDSSSDAYIQNKPENLVQDANYVHTDNNYTDEEKTKLAGIEAGAEVNVIETVKVDDIPLTVAGKTVNIDLSGKADKAANLTGATKTKITYNSQGIVTAGADLEASDIPNLDASKITSGTLPVERGGTGSSTVEGARTNLDVYSKSEVDARLNGRIEVVSTLPTTGETGVTYYVGPQGSGSDQYEEYIWAKKDGASTESWIKVGDRTIDLSGYKTKQTAKTSPTASGNTLSFIDTISQNENGEITATKKTIQSASGTQDGVMSSSHYTKLEGISTGANKVGASTTNGNIKIDGTETTVYTHPTDGADTSKGDTTNQTPAFGGTFKVTSETVDAMGHTTVLAEHTVKIPNATAVASTGGTGGSAGLMSAADKEKLNGIATGAEVNQNAFSNVKVGTATVAADAKTDTIEFATTSGKHIVLTADIANDKVTIDTDLSSKSAASGGTAESLVTTGEKYTWNSKASGTHTHGNITNDGKIGSTADLAVVTGTDGAVTTADLTTASPSVPSSGTTTSLSFIDTVSQDGKGQITATKKTVLVDSTYSSTGTNPVNGKAIAAAIGGLDSNKTSTDGTNVQFKVTLADGKVSAVNVTTDNTENRNNKVTAWSATTTDTHYPSETLVKTSLDGKVDKVEGKGLSTEDYTTAEKTKLAGIAAGAEVNQNAFSNVKVGSTTVSADSKTDTLELASSSAITLTPDATNDKVTIGVSTMGAASSSASGTAGIVPAPGAGKQASFLRGDGTWVVPTNTDTLVKATAKTDNVNYKILATASASPTSGNATEAVYDTDISLNPSTNTITSNISGNAATSTKPAVTTLTSSDNLNNVGGSAAGNVLWYKWPSGSAPANVPITGSAVMEVVRTHSNNYITQTVYTTEHSVYRRECVNGTWGAWYSYSKSTHTHGNITSDGALQTTDVAIANGDKLVITDASDSNKIARSSTAFDGTTITKALTQKGTFESVMLADDAMPLSATDGVKITYSGSTATISGNFAAGAGVGITYANNVATFSADISAIPLATIAALS